MASPLSFVSLPCPRKRLIPACLGGLLLTAAPALSAAAQAAPTLSGATSRPDISVFIPGEEIPISFEINGLDSGSKPTLVQVKVVDEKFRPILEKKLPLQQQGDKLVARLQAPNSRLGFYRVYATLPGGATLPVQGSLPGGYLTYCIVPDPALRPKLPMKEARFGMQGGFNGRLNVLPYLGVRWVNGPFTWKRNESEGPGQFARQRQADKAAGKTGPLPEAGATRFYEWNHVVRNGKREAWTIYPVFSVYDPPEWAIVPKTRVGHTARLSEQGKAGWAAYCREVGKAAAEDFPHLEEHVFQLTWEPNWFNGTAQDFVDIYKLAHENLHATDPRAMVIGPTKTSIGRYGMDQEAEWFKMGLGKYLDMYSVHPYFRGEPEQTSYFTDWRWLKNHIKSASGRDIPMVGTEQGRLTHEDPLEELPQARELMRANLIALGEGARFNFAFYIHDYKGSEPGFGYFYNLLEDKRFGTDRIAPKPVAPAFAAQSFLLDGHDAAGAINWLGATTHGYAFERGNSVVLALWDFGSAPRQVTIPAGAPAVEVFDWMGNGTRQNTSKGNLTLTLGPEPVYVRGVAPALWGSGAKRPLHIEHTRLRVAPGGSVKIEGVARPDRTQEGPYQVVFGRAGTTQWQLPAQNVVPAASGEAPFSVEQAVPLSTRPGLYPVEVELRSRRGSVAKAMLSLQVEAPFHLISTLPEVTATEAGLRLSGMRVDLREPLSARVEGTVSASWPGTQAPAATGNFTLTPDSNRPVKLALDSPVLEPGRNYNLPVQVQSKGGYSAQFQRRIGLLPVASLPQAANAAATNWEGVAPLHMEGAQWLTRGQTQHRGNTDLSARLQTGWNKDGLHLRVECTDDVLVRSSEKEKGDTLRIAVNLDPGQKYQPTGNTFADKLSSPRYTAYEVVLTATGPVVRRTATFYPEQYPLGALTATELPCSVTRQNNATVYQLTIPWTALGRNDTPPANDIIGLGVQLEDSDAPGKGAAKTIGIFGGWEGDIPSEWGLGVLR